MLSSHISINRFRWTCNLCGYQVEMVMIRWEGRPLRFFTLYISLSIHNSSTPLLLEGEIVFSYADCPNYRFATNDSFTVIRHMVLYKQFIMCRTTLYLCYLKRRYERYQITNPYSLLLQDSYDGKHNLLVLITSS